MLVAGERRQRRAPMACDFCRRRKMKCNNEKPECENCREHKRDCNYAELARKPRPSTVRITQLEHENRRLRESLSRLSGNMESTERFDDIPATELLEPTIGLVSCQTRASVPCSNLSIDLVRPQSPNLMPPGSEIAIKATSFSPDKETLYHGPTSAVFDEKSTESRVSNSAEGSAKVPEVWIKRQLVAESVRQRQLETVYFLAGKLDFDGVDPDLGMHLLSLYWNRQHSSGPVVYRTAFMRDMACAGPYFSKLLLNAIYFHACKYTLRVEVRHNPDKKLTAGWVYRQRAAELLSESFDRSSITTIQALLVMSSVLFSWCDEKSISWLYAGMAFNMIIDLGIHVDVSSLKLRHSEEDYEIRRRVYWSAYSLDKFQSLYQGRPACLLESTTTLPITFMDDHEELELFNSLSYTELTSSQLSPVYSISTFTESCKLSVILERVLRSMYTERKNCRNTDELLSDFKTLDSELESWRKSLPPHLDLEWSNIGNNQMPHTLALLATYNVLVILLHRSLLSDGNLQLSSASEALDAFSKCCAASFEIDQILRAYGHSFCFKTTPYIISYATYVSATIHVRLAAQRESGSSAHKALGRCLNVLDIHQSVCYAPKRVKRVVDALITRMGVVVDRGDSGESNGSTPDDIDINAIIQSFARDQVPADSWVQYLPSSLEVGGDNSNVSSNFPMQPSTCMVANDNNLIQQEMVPMGDDLGFMYDPIFGFNGSAFDSFDFVFEGSPIQN